MHSISAADFPLFCSNSAWKRLILPEECFPQKSLLCSKFIQAYSRISVIRRADLHATYMWKYFSWSYPHKVSNCTAQLRIHDQAHPLFSLVIGSHKQNVTSSTTKIWLWFIVYRVLAGIRSRWCYDGWSCGCCRRRCCCQWSCRLRWCAHHTLENIVNVNSLSLLLFFPSTCKSSQQDD